MAEFLALGRAQRRWNMRKLQTLEEAVPLLTAPMILCLGCQLPLFLPNDFVCPLSIRQSFRK
jgi:hypothetical protein